MIIKKGKRIFFYVNNKKGIFIFLIFLFLRIIKLKTYLLFFSLLNGSIKLAEKIASKSPVAIQGSKLSLIYSRDHTVQEGLDHIVSFNIFPPIKNLIIFLYIFIYFFKLYFNRSCIIRVCF